MTSVHKVTISAIPWEYVGDWHDRPLRWEVRGPNGELQKFSTKKWAEKYAALRRSSVTEHEAGARFAASSI